MIVEDQRESAEKADFVEDDADFDETVLEETNVSRYVRVNKQIRNKDVHHQLREDLVDHIFEIYKDHPINKNQK